MLRSAWYSRYSAELLATMAFQVIGSLGATPWANALALASCVMFAAKTSMAILNPALTLSFCATGYVRPRHALGYVASQVAGSLLGSLWLALLVPGAWKWEAHTSDDVSGANVVGCFTPDAGLSDARIFLLEMTGSLVFYATVLAVLKYTALKKGYGNVGPIMIGIGLAASAAAREKSTGGALNPARVLAPWLVLKCSASGSQVGLYIAGQLAAAALAPAATIPWYGVSQEPWWLSSADA